MLFIIHRTLMTSVVFVLIVWGHTSSSSSCSPVNPMVTMRLKYDVSILVCHVRCPSLPSYSVVNDSSPLVYYWSTSCMNDLCCVFPVYSNVVLWLAVCPRTFLIRGQTTWDVSFLSLRLLSGVGLLCCRTESVGHCCSSFLCCCSKTLELASSELSNCSICYYI